MKLRFGSRDLWCAWLMATVFSGLPSTLHALVTGADPLEAARAAGAMLVPTVTDTLTLVAAAAIVHPSVSLFWTAVFGWLLPRRHVTLWAVAGSGAVALLDLRVIAPLVFPSVAALPFWPQFADHLMGRAAGRNAAGANESRPADRGLGARDCHLPRDGQAGAGV